MTYEASPGSLASLTVFPETYRVREEVPYTFNFITTNKVLKDGGIQIVVPETISVVSEASLSLTPIASMNQLNTIAISYDESTHTITISNAFTENNDN